MKGRTIVITSGKGGVGKTTATANIGTGLAMRGHRVVVVDTDIGLRNLDVIMGLENRIVYDLVNVIEGDCKLNQAMIADKHDYELYLIPAAQTRDKNSVSPEQLREMCEELEKEFEELANAAAASAKDNEESANPARQEEKEREQEEKWFENPENDESAGGQLDRIPSILFAASPAVNNNQKNKLGLNSDYRNNVYLHLLVHTNCAILMRNPHHKNQLFVIAQ